MLLTADTAVVILICSRDFDAARARGSLACNDLRVSFEVLNLVLLQQVRHAATDLRRDVAAAPHDLRPINLHCCWINIESPVTTMSDRFQIQLGVVQQRLCWNASPVEADASKLAALHTRDLHPHLRCANRADVSARTSADDDEIEMLCICHD